MTKKERAADRLKTVADVPENRVKSLLRPGGTPDPQGSLLTGTACSQEEAFAAGGSTRIKAPAENGDGNALGHPLDSDGRKATSGLCEALRCGCFRDGHPDTAVDAGLLAIVKVFKVPRLVL